MKAPIFVAVIAVLSGAPSLDAAGAAGGAAQSQRGDEQTERITRTVRLGQNGQLLVTNLAGDIVVTGGGGDDVTIEAVKRTNGPRDELAEVSVNIEERTGSITVGTDYERSDRSSSRRRRNGVSVAFTITVPAATNLDLRSVSGTVRVTGVRGAVRGETFSGNVVTSQSPRVEAAKTVSGSIDVADAALDGELALASMSGNITARRLKARRLQASTVSGDIDVSVVSVDRVEMKSMSGDLRFGGTLSPNGRYSVNSHSGDVVMRLDTSNGFQLNATSFSGEVTSDIPMTLGSRRGDPSGRRSGASSRRSVRGVFGDGSSVLDVSTFSGDIHVARP